MDEGLLFVDIFITADNATFPGAIGASERDIADFIAGKYEIQSILVMTKVYSVIWRQWFESVL